jgi:hypothetical protein
MKNPGSHVYGPATRQPVKALTFTPAEWRHILEDIEFLEDPDNRFSVPRRLMGLPVEIVPDHGIRV